MAGNGIIYLVGAGPGDPDLLTIQASNLIGRADLVSCDGFVSDRIVAIVPQAKLHQPPSTAEPRGKPTVGEAIDPLIAEAKKGKTVVRLKGGDPWLFSRTDLEARACVEAGVAFEIVAGVTSALACFGEIGVPLTEKGVSDCLEIRTAAGKNPAGDASPEGKKTQIFMMAEEGPGELAAQLIERGFSPRTAVCAVADCARTGRRAVFGTLASIGRKTEGVGGPMILAVGRGVAESRRIVSPVRQAASATPDFKMFDLLLRGLAQFDWAIPDCPESARAFLSRASALGVDVHGRENLRIAAMDDRTANALSGAGVRNVIRLPRESAEELRSALAAHGPLVGGRFLAPHIAGAKPAWTESIIKFGGIVVGADALGAAPSPASGEDGAPGGAPGGGPTKKM